MHPLIAIPATAALVYRAWSRRSLTPAGILAALATAVAHALHPWSVFFALLALFFLGGTAATKVKHEQKAKLTLSAAGGNHASSSSGGGGPEARTSTQVLANSLTASVFITLHWLLSPAPLNCVAKPDSLISSSSPSYSTLPFSSSFFFFFTDSFISHALIPALPYGIVATYAAVAADTFSSELGILSRSPPILLSSLPAAICTLSSPRRVPPGTNGGVTVLGLGAGAVGAAVIAMGAVALMPFCGEWSVGDRIVFVLCVVGWGTLGSVLDSVLGAVLQASVVETRSGKVVEGVGGAKVLSDGLGRKVVSGWDVLSNNGVNFVMAAVMGCVAVVGVAWMGT